ncbi:MAG TPA: helix-turn-helix transcriptional regulator [Baekduia sp.]|uniref:helix-turn-helix domain-containing protein n=1 Tax=Baekduia sp. TaxID=2600305 RepID=UPI002D77E6D9|nr:helix-turn-helix transcriptional regulator [Baekduia sp.]HET6508360.1 helix-turn-helix transcriptional regulator [Baekduia sp.]
MAVLGTPAGSVIRELREGARLTQATVAEGLHISQPQYSRLENGRDRLTSDEWASVAPALALGIYVPDPPPLADLVYLVCWVPSDAGRLADAIYPCIGVELPLFADALLACRVAAVLDVFGLRGACAIAATPRAADDLIFRLTRVNGTHRIPRRGRGELPAATEALSFASEAFSRFVGDLDRNDGVPSVQAVGTPRWRVAWREDRFAAQRSDDTEPAG